MQSLDPYVPTMVADGAAVPVSQYVELNGFNLATHTTALEQSVLGKTHLGSTTGPTLLPPTICGKRSRSNSDASSFSSSSRVFSSEHDETESGCDSQTSVGEQSPSSRKSSISEGPCTQQQQQQLDSLAIWRAELHAATQSERERCAKRIRDLQGEVVRLASEVVNTGSQPTTVSHAVAPAPAPVAAPSTSPAPPSLFPSDGSKNVLVDCLVDATCRTLDAIWNASASSSRCDLAKGKSALPLQVFVRETLRRGRTSCSTLQAALIYCVRLSEAAERSQQVSLKDFTRAPGVEVNVETQASSPLLGMTKEELFLIRCPRRMFLASVMVAAKFVQDRCYSNRAWSKISGLPVKDLGKLERAFVKAIDYRLVVSEAEFEQWTVELKRLNATQNASFSTTSSAAGRRSSLSRSQSDNVTGAAVALDTELRAVSPCLSNQVQTKSHLLEKDQQATVVPADIALPFPRVCPAV